MPKKLADWSPADVELAAEQAAAVFPVKDALLYLERHPLGGPKKGFQGDAFYAAENPPYGAVFTSYMKEKIKTKKEKRQEAEKDAAKKNQTLPYPSNDALRAKAEEAKPEVYFMVYDESGTAIRRVEGSAEGGFQRRGAERPLRHGAAVSQRSQRPDPAGPLPQAHDGQALTVGLQTGADFVRDRFIGQAHQVHGGALRQPLQHVEGPDAVALVRRIGEPMNEI